MIIVNNDEKYVRIIQNHEIIQGYEICSRFLFEITKKREH